MKLRSAATSLLVLSFTVVGCGKGLNISAGTGQDPNAAITKVFASYQASVTLVQSRMLTVQNTDGGWDWMDTPANLQSSTSTPTANSNMFGVNAVGVLDANSVTANAAAVNALQTTANYLMAKPLSRTQRLYANDCEFLIKFGDAVGNSAYRDRGSQGQVYEREYLAAVSIFATTAPTDAQVNSLTSAQIASVTDAQLAQASRARFLANGRDAATRAYDWGARMRVSALRGDASYQREMANIAAADFTEISSAASPSLLGLAATISDLTPFKSEASFAAVIAQARTLLLSRQGSDGLFGGDPQEDAFTAHALYDTGDYFQLAVFLSVLRNQITADGYLLDASGNEIPEAQSELLSALAVIVKL